MMYKYKPKYNNKSVKGERELMSAEWIEGACAGLFLSVASGVCPESCSMLKDSLLDLPCPAPVWSGLARRKDFLVRKAQFIQFAFLAKLF
ncbi:hypothetical protein ACLKA7_016285 [Drosophila subpalustris]